VSKYQPVNTSKLEKTELMTEQRNH